MMRCIVWMVLWVMATGFAGDWAQWRGPFQNGTSDETNLVDALTPQTLLWKQSLQGVSAATPVTADGRIYMVTVSDDRKQLLGQCLDAITGTPLWQKRLTDNTPRFPQGNTIGSCSPCVDATGVVFFCGNGTLVKFDLSGNQRWKRNLIDDYGPFAVKFGYSSSPLLLDGTLFIPVLRYPKDKSVDGLDSYLLGVDGATGKTIFKQNRPTDTDNEGTNAYTTPLSAMIDGERHLIVYGGNFITGHDPVSGVERWRCGYIDTPLPFGRTISNPVIDNGRLLCAYPTGTKAMAYDLSKLAAGTCQRLWTREQKVSDAPSPTVVDGHVYFIEEKSKTLVCIDGKTGSVRWSGQLDKSDQYYASITAADGKLYMVNRKGVVTVAAADAKAFRILSTHDFGGRPTDSTITIANGHIYLRTAEMLYCFGTH